MERGKGPPGPNGIRATAGQQPVDWTRELPDGPPSAPEPVVPSPPAWAPPGAPPSRWRASAPGPVASEAVMSGATSTVPMASGPTATTATDTVPVPPWGTTSGPPPGPPAPTGWGTPETPTRPPPARRSWVGPVIGLLAVLVLAAVGITFLGTDGDEPLRPGDSSTDEEATGRPTPTPPEASGGGSRPVPEREAPSREPIPAEGPDDIEDLLGDLEDLVGPTDALSGDLGPCLEVSFAYAGVYLSVLGGDAAVDDALTTLDELADDVPVDLQDDLAVIAAGIGEADDLLALVDFFGSEAYLEADANVSAFLEQTCGI